jgi:hypothetical protein
LALSPRLESVAKALPPGLGFLVPVPIKRVGDQHALCVREQRAVDIIDKDKQLREFLTASNEAKLRGLF